VSDDPQLTIEDALAAEYRAVRPDVPVDAASAAARAAAIHADAAPLSALCISGGGIRSATFGLGAIQGLAEHGLLQQFDYLSTVSGGGYIGGWLTAWKNRVGGLDRVIPRLRRDAPPPAPGEPDPIQHLRDYNSYLSPRAGLLSTDLWTLLATILRNILLNWLVLIPMLMFGLMLPRLFLSALAFPDLFFSHAIFAGDGPGDYSAAALDDISHHPLVVWVLPLLSGVLLTCALFFILRYLPGVGNSDPSRFDYVRRILAPLVGAAITFMTFDSLYYIGSHYADRGRPWRVIGWTLVASAAAWLLNLVVHRQSFGDRLHVLFGTTSLAVLSMAIGTGLATWIATDFVLFSPHPETYLSWAAYVTVGLPAILLGFCLGTVLFVGFSSAVLKDEDREWMSRAVAEVMLVSTAWLVICAAVLLAPKWALTWQTWMHGVLVAAAAGSAWLSTYRGTFPANAGSTTAAARKTPLSLSLAARVAPAVFLALLAVGLSILVNVLLWVLHRIANLPLTGNDGAAVSWQDHYGMLERSHPALVGLLAVAFLLVGGVTSRFININTFSLHGMYRDRLIRAYLGASNPKRTVSRFTGFARNDDLPMGSLNSALKPLHVVNLTLNVVATSRLAWQQRKAESFTATALHCGNSNLGYRPTAEYGGGITLGTAVALSGAAASPNMGYHSSPVVGFIMALFNARLGAWLGNPGRPGRLSWKLPGPQVALRPLFREVAGQTTDQSKFVYLSDGGHFENLALYEMVRRRCRLIVVLDSGCDPDFTFDDLGNALRKIRIDFGIPIRFDEEDTRPLRQRRRRCALATIGYSSVDGPCEDGRLIYIKPMLLGTEPPDVQSYAAAHPAFPHQSTAEQWFNESQTESHRQLGLLTIDEMCGNWKGKSLGELYAHLKGGYLREGG
jgi:hypothetical protein